MQCSWSWLSPVKPSTLMGAPFVRPGNFKEIVIVIKHKDNLSYTIWKIKQFHTSSVHIVFFICTYFIERSIVMIIRPVCLYNAWNIVQYMSPLVNDFWRFAIKLSEYKSWTQDCHNSSFNYHWHVTSDWIITIKRVFAMSSIEQRWQLLKQQKFPFFYERIYLFMLLCIICGDYVP
jgi:hypothetical protein